MKIVMTLQEIKKEIEKHAEAALGQRNMSLTEVERIKVRIQALIALAQITQIIEKDEPA